MLELMDSLSWRTRLWICDAAETSMSSRCARLSTRDRDFCTSRVKRSAYSVAFGTRKAEKAVLATLLRRLSSPASHFPHLSAQGSSKGATLQRLTSPEVIDDRAADPHDEWEDKKRQTEWPQYPH